jgi:apolipoprotein N-acyltransferase
MQDIVSTVARGRQSWPTFVASRVRIEAPSLVDWAAALLSSVLLTLSFPDFGFWFLAWIGLIPLLLVIARRPSASRAFALGWLAGTVFFYATCYWLTYSIIHYGGFPVWAAFLLLVPGAVILGLFPAAFALVLSGALRRWRNKAILLAPFIWVSIEWARLEITGQLWNAIGYSQAYQTPLIQTARWGGVYAVGFLILAINSAIAFLILNHCKKALTISLAVILAVAIACIATHVTSWEEPGRNAAVPDLLVVALQPNVPMDPSISTAELEKLLSLHISESQKALEQFAVDAPRLVVWPESPMNFAYGTDPKFQDLVARFARQNRTAVLFNSLEPAPEKGVYNSALLVDEEGRAIAQYDKIRLMPFGEYVPLPDWLPGASLITAIVGDFTPGNKYTLIPAGRLQVGVFICIESAYPWIARNFAAEGADALINISNDGYLGPTAVMRQHLANAVFRAVENGRPLLRVTNTGITAFITAAGEVKGETGGFQRMVRVWLVDGGPKQTTFYTRHGDVLAGLSAVLTTIVFLLTLRGIKKESRG